MAPVLPFRPQPPQGTSGGFSEPITVMVVLGLPPGQPPDPNLQEVRSVSFWHNVRAGSGAFEGTETDRLPTAEPERRVTTRRLTQFGTVAKVCL